MKKSSKLIGVLLATSMFLGACEKESGANPTDSNKPSDQEHVHSFGEWETKKEATCKEAGSKERKCSGCDVVETEELPKLTTHTFGDWEITAATCEEKGKKERTCSVCGEKESEEIDATGHNYGEWEETPATCAADGSKTRTCATCGKVETETLPKLTEHKFNDWTYNVTTGKVNRVCPVCGLKEEQEAETPEETWSADEQTVIDTYFYGANIPYMKLDGEEALAYDTKYKEGDKYAPNCSAEILAAYAAMFGDNWYDNGTEVSETKIIYRLEGKIETPDGIRYVDVYIYGLGQNEQGYYITADGSGEFCLSVESPYVYSFDDTLINLAAMYYFNAGIEIPAVTSAEYFQDDSSAFNSQGKWYCFCFGDPDAMIEETFKNLIAAGFTYKGTNEETYYEEFIPQDEEYLLGVGYNPKYGLIMLCITDLPGIPEINGDALNATNFAINPEASGYNEYQYTGASGAKYLANASATNGFAINNRTGHGIVVTESVGTVSGVKVKFNDQTAKDVVIEVYGSNEAFTIDDMFAFDDDNPKQLVALGMLKVDADFEAYLVFETQFAFVGFRVVGGTAIIESITVAWTIPQVQNPDQGGEGEGQGEGQGEGGDQGNPQGNENA